MAASDHDTARRVDDANGHIRQVCNKGQYLRLGGNDGDHAAQRLRHQPAPLDHEPQAIGQGEDPRGVCRRKVAQAMAQDEVRLNAPRPP